LFSIPGVENAVEGNRSQDMEEIKGKAMTQLLDVPKSQCPKCFGQWKDCWNKCVASEGDYFEGDYDCNTRG